MPIKEIILASNNENKIKEIKSLLAPLNIKLVSLVEMSLEDPVEDGKSFEENALIKARYAYEKTGLPSLADDSGFCVDSLNDFPGICSARFAKSVGGYPEAFRILNDCINPIHKNSHFITTLAFVYNLNDSLEEKVFEGRINGEFVYPAKGSNGFGYCSVFRPEGYGETFGEMSDATKTSINHRSIALKKFFDFVKEL